MTNHPHIEIERKALVATRTEIDAILKHLEGSDPHSQLLLHTSQLNHYFIDGNFSAITFLTAADKQSLLEQIAAAASTSVRTRCNDNGPAIFIVKTSISESADNAISRQEFEVQTALDIEALDGQLLESGFSVQAKWSAERDIHSYQDVRVELIFSPGYGYQVEVEKIVSDPAESSSAEDRVATVMNELGLQPVDPQRLKRMFEYYNRHWADYYGTDKVFNVQ